jgi:hypothetical protein
MIVDGVQVGNIQNYSKQPKAIPSMIVPGK